MWILLICFSPRISSAQDAQPEPWKSEGFVKKAQAIKAGDWEDVTSKDVAIVALYEMGHTLDTVMDKIERRLESRVNRLYSLAWVGVLVLAAYLIAQLVMTLVLIIRVGRRPI